MTYLISMKYRTWYSREDGEAYFGKEKETLFLLTDEHPVQFVARTQIRLDSLRRSAAYTHADEILAIYSITEAPDDLLTENERNALS